MVMTGGKRFSKESLLRVAEVLFLSACCCYFVFKTGVLERFYADHRAAVENALIWFLLVLAVCRLILLWPEEKKLISGACGLAAVMAVISFVSGAGNPGAFSAMILGCAGLRFERLARVRAVTWLWYTLGMIFGCLTGFFSIFVRFSQGDLRSAWGFAHPVTMATHVFLSVLFLWLAFPAIPDGIILLLCAVSFWIGKDITHSETGMICSVVLFLLVLLHMMPVQKWFAGGWRKRLKQTVQALMCLSFPLLAGAYYFLVWRLREGSAFAASVNQWLTGRLDLALRGFEEFGVPAFGADYKINALTGTGYNVLDSLYALAVVRYGWIFLTVMACAFVYFARRCFKNGNRRIAYGMVLAAVYSFAEPLFENAHVNLFVCLAFCKLEDVRQTADVGDGGNKRRARNDAKIAAWGAVVALSLLMVLLLPKIFSCMRTVYLQFEWVGKAERVFLLIGAAFLVTGVFLACVYRMVFLLWRRKPLPRRILVVSGICCLLFAVSALKLGSMVRAERESYAETMKEMAPVMELVLDTARGSVVAETLPEVYSDYYPAITRSWRRSEEMAFEKDITFLTSRWVGQGQLMAQGFRYLQMSDIHSLYTNEAAVVQALRDAGYHIASFNYSYVSETYGGPENEFRGIPVRTEAEGGTGNLRADMSGDYTVEFDLNFLEGRPQQDLSGVELCTLRAYSVNNDKVVAERTVMGDEVGRSGWNTYELKFSVKSGIVDLSVIAGETYPMCLTEIRYRQTPDYDIFDTRNEAGKVIRREYYDLEGQAVVLANGASVITYEYDEAGNNTVQYYFDTEDQPVMTARGYAGLHRVFDEKKHVIHEHYTGTKGEAVVIPAGYAAKESEYNEAGKEILCRYYDTEGNPVMLPDGYAMKETGYDAAGNAADHYYFDGEGRPVMTADGYAELHRTFDEKKNIIREAYADTEGKPVAASRGYAAYEAEYDAAGNAIVIRYYGTDGKPVPVGDGYAELHRVYGGNKKITEESYFDGEGKPLMLAAGYAVEEREYDAAGNLVRRRFYDPDRNPVLNANGVFEIRRQYDDWKRLIWEEYADTEGGPAARKDGVWAFARVYGEDGKVSEEAYYDIDGQPFTP